MWADNETSEDLLGFKVHADLLINVINDEQILPVTIGVFGDWGSGKSSILKIIESELSSKDPDELKDDTLVLYFNGWVFEGYDDAKAALLESIIKKFQEHKKLGPKIKEKADELLKSVDWMRLLGLGFKKVVLPGAAAILTGGASIVPHLIGEFTNIKTEDLKEKLTGDGAESFLEGLIKKKEKGEDAMSLRGFRDNFKKMIDDSKIKKLVVIIDDLDRCTPERLIENLEAIKLFLNVEKTAFLIGADPRIVRHAIEHRYKTDRIENSGDPDSENKRIISDYLEKLIQIPYNLPKLSDSEVETYMTLLFCKNHLKDQFSKVHEAFCAYKEKDRYGIFGLGNLDGLISDTQRSELGQTVTLIAAMSTAITEGLNGNPRQTKRFLNTFTLRKRLVQVAKFSDFKDEVLAKLMVLEYASPSLFKQLHIWQSTQDGMPKEIVQLEELAEKNDKEGMKSASYGDWASDRLMKWLKVSPTLSDTDLRNYYWIARDQLTSTISGASLIPEHIRSLHKKLNGYGGAKILERTIRENVLTISVDRDLENILNLFERQTIKHPEEERNHEILIEMMKQGVPNSIKTYGRIISQVDNNTIPYHLHNQIKTAIGANPLISEILKEFKHSKILTALKTK